jgi:hypothetical protein
MYVEPTGHESVAVTLKKLVVFVELVPMARVPKLPTESRMVIYGLEHRRVPTTLGAASWPLLVMVRYMIAVSPGSSLPLLWGEPWSFIVAATYCRLHPNTSWYVV